VPRFLSSAMWSFFHACRRVKLEFPNASAAHRSTWFSLSIGRSRSSSKTRITPAVLNPLPPNKTASADAGTVAFAYS
jgi:hypothetical protein